jgi:ABC-type multidrug transport system permease subunit
MWIVKNIVGLIAALVLMALCGVTAFFMARTTPGIHPGFFYGAALSIYTMLMLALMHFNPLRSRRRSE